MILIDLLSATTLKHLRKVSGHHFFLHLSAILSDD